MVWVNVVHQDYIKKWVKMYPNKQVRLLNINFFSADSQLSFNTLQLRFDLKKMSPLSCVYTLVELIPH